MRGSERMLWAALRRLNDNWRRQAPLGRFIVDFANHGRKLVVEVDGGVHRLPHVAQRDAERDAWLNAQGYRVMRVTDRRVRDELETVIAELVRASGVRPPD